MICKKCGCDAMIKSGDWYTCPICGAKTFDLGFEQDSPTMVLYDMDKRSQPSDTQKKADEKINNKPEKSRKTDKKKDKSTKKIKSAPTEKPSSESEASQKGADDEKPKKSKLRENIEFFIPIIVAVIIAILLKIFVFANAVVPTGSMLNTIQEKDRIIASRLAYVNSNPERYDIVIFRYPDNEKEIFVKRVIGLPGEMVEIKNGVVFVTGKNGEVTQLDSSFVTNCKPDGDFGPYVVPEDSYFMMGDNRNSSWDSRYWDNKFVHKSKILGKVMFRYYPHYSKLN